jgi:hypothetical protein
MNADDEARFVAGVDLVSRTGASAVSVRYSDEDKPIVFVCVATYPDGTWEVGAGGTPGIALVRLLEQLVNGGLCTHCGRPSGFEPESLDAMPLNTQVCWTQWDPELATYRRACA